MKHPLALAAVALIALLGTVVPATGEAQTEGGPPPALALTPLATLDYPIAMAARAGTEDLYVAQRDGVVRRLEVTGPDVALSPTPVINISRFIATGGEGGLLGLAFNPAGTRLYLHHTNRAGDTRLVEYRMNASGRRAIGRSRRLVLAVDQPASNHNGGTVTFGPDRRLYLALGDGGGAGDPRRNAQNLRRLLGKVLRINPNATARAAYTVPGQNPYALQRPRRGEIWLRGVRNPWRIAFDPDNGDLYVADVGQNAVEEVTVLPADGGGRNAGRGTNLGWRRMEGDQVFVGSGPPPGHTGPTFTYGHGSPCRSITGGYVYRGSAIPALDGTYLYGDWCTGVIGGIEATGGVLTASTPDLGLPPLPFELVSFGQDNHGEIYVLASGGEVSRIDPA